MSEININLDWVRELSGTMENCISSVGSVRNDLGSLRVDSQILKLNGIDRRMRQMLSSLSEIQKDLGNIHRVVATGAECYAHTDAALCSRFNDETPAVCPAVLTGGHPADQSADQPANLENPLKSMIVDLAFGAFKGSNVGKAAGVLFNPVANWFKTGKFELSDKTGAVAVCDVLKDFADSAKGICDLFQPASSANQTFLGKLVGTEATMEGASTAAKWSDRVAENIETLQEKEVGEYLLRKDANGVLTKSKVVGTVAKWAGAAFTAGTNVAQSVQDYNDKKITGERAVENAVVRTGVDLAKDALITIGVTAVVVAAVGSAPVVVTGIAAAATGALLDAAAKAITKKYCGEEKGFTEAVSDLAIDTWNNRDEIIQKTGNWLQGTCGKLAGCFSHPAEPAQAGWKTALGY